MTSRVVLEVVRNGRNAIGVSGSSFLGLPCIYIEGGRRDRPKGQDSSELRAPWFRLTAVSARRLGHALIAAADQINPEPDDTEGRKP
ncbi:hypothetical protein NS226_00795 [Aureimonas ureilytica]|uniref:Uncharacterized protein n=1 Tax=Aureimonas ureilytica TaxID=401562 RepID=A0A175RFY5_9HYPH|nr:hypothetical protein [Aureimonas ureilytica]KTQ98581.1 hypothetical protein NS226_00795 [Aureimonas ureilytica]